MANGQLQKKLGINIGPTQTFKIGNDVVNYDELSLELGPENVDKIIDDNLKNNSNFNIAKDSDIIEVNKEKEKTKDKFALENPIYKADSDGSDFVMNFERDFLNEDSDVGTYDSVTTEDIEQNINDPLIQLPNGKIVKKSIAARYDLLKSLENSVSAVPPEEISPLSENISEVADNFVKKQADGVVGEDNRNSKSLIEESRELFTILRDNDEFLNKEFMAVHLHKNKDKITEHAQDIAGRFDFNTEEGVNNFNEELNKYIHKEILVPATETDKNFLQRNKDILDVVNQRYAKGIESKTAEEKRNEILPDWLEGDGLLASMGQSGWKFLKQQQGNWFGMMNIIDAKQMEAHNEYLTNIDLKTDELGEDGMVYQNPKTGEISRGMTASIRNKVSLKDAKKNVNQLKVKNQLEFLEELTKSKKYQKIVEELGSAELLAKDFDIRNIGSGPIFDTDAKEVADAFITQGGQFLLSFVTLGGNTMFQESVGAYNDIVTGKAAERAFPDDPKAEEKFNALSVEEQGKHMMAVVDDGEADINTALATGGINTAIDLVGNTFVGLKAVKGFAEGGKGLIKNLIRSQYKKGLKKVGAGAVGTATTLGVDGIAEALQEITSMTTVGQSLEDEFSKDGFSGFVGRAMKNNRQISESFVQAIVTGGGITQGATAIGTTKNTIGSIIKSNDPKALEHYYKQQEAKIKLMDPKLQEAAYKELDAAMDFSQNTKYKKLDPKAKEMVFDNQLQIEAENTRLQELEKLTKKSDQKGRPTNAQQQAEVDIQASIDKITELENSNKKEVDILDYNTTGQAIIKNINESKEGEFKNKNAKSFKTKKDFKEFITNKFKGKTIPKDYQNFLDGDSNGVVITENGIDNAFFINERVAENIRKGDAFAKNVIHHEATHLLLSGMDDTTVQQTVNNIKTELNNSTDPALKQAAETVNAVLKGRDYSDQSIRIQNEEYLAALSDVVAVAKGTDLNLEQTSTWSKIGNLFGGLVNKQMPGFDVKGLQSGDSALEFVKKFNEWKGKGPVISSDKLFNPANRDIPAREQKSMQDDINNTLLETIKSEQTTDRDKGQAIQSIIENNPIIYKALGFNLAKGTVTQAEIDSAITAELLGAEGGRGIINTYDGSTKFSTYLQNIFSKRRQQVYEAAGLDMKGAVTGSLQAEQAREVVDTEDITGKVDKVPTRKREKVTEKVLSKEFNFDGIDVAVANLMLGADFKVPKDYKSAKDIAPALTAELFGVDPYQYMDPNKSLKKSDVIAARTFIRKNPELLHGLLPNNLTTQGKATGVRKLLLDKFYEKTGKRKEAALGRSKQGSFVLKKKPFNQKQFLKEFGIIPGQVMKVTNQTQQSGIISALMNETGKIMTNQAIRKNLPKVEGMREAAQKLSDGKSRVVWQKSLSGIKGLNDIVTKAKQLPLDSNAKRDRALMRDWSINEMPKYFPASIILADTFGPSSKRSGKFFFNKQERDKIKKLAAKNENHNLKPEEVIALKGAFGSKSNTWFKQDLTKGLYKRKTDNNTAGIEIMIKQFKKMYKKNPGNIKFIAGVFAGQADATGHVLRQIALPNGESKINGAKINEHVIPSSWMSNFILDTIVKNKHTNARINWIKDNYFQLRILKTDDTKVSDAGFTTVLPTEFITELDKAIETGDFSNVPSPLIRYVHPKVNAIRNGFDLNKITYKNQTLAQYYNIDVKGVYINNTTKGIQQQLAYEIETKKITKDQARKYIDSYLKIASEVKKTANVNSAVFSNFLNADMSVTQQIKTLQNIDKALRVARDPKAQEKGITIVDFDQTLAITEEKVLYSMPDGTTDKLTALEFAEQSEQLQRDGATFDFSEFENVKGATKGPFFDIAQQIKGKFGNKDIFVLTARPQAAAVAIQSWLKGAGLDIKLENITGLENGTPQAKANYVIEKASQGYNNFLFADDVYANVKAVQGVLDVVDVKRDVQQARESKFVKIDEEFDKIIEENTGLNRNATVSVAKAKQIGATRGSWLKDFFLAPSSEDFTGLMYTLIGKGKKGEKQFEFVKNTLIRPFARGIRDLNAAKQVISNEFANLKKIYPDVTKSLRKPSPVKGYNNSHAIRVYLWNKNGIPIPGLSKTDQAALVKHVNNNPDMKVFADQAGQITKLEEGYTTPSNSWMIGNISTDMMDVSNKVKRSEYLKEYLDNYEKMFTPERLNKLELIYGSKFVEALNDMKYRMEYGTNRSQGQDRITQKWQNWVNNSVGAIMFFNMRSAVLQTLSSVNFVNWNDNNPFKAAKALANQKQYWKDFSYIFNHPTLKQRRAGLDIDVNASEIASRVADSKDKISAGLNHLLQLGFTPTRIADSFAIASGGATFYRNRIETYVKQGLSKKRAEEKAFLDFQEISEATQQSARPDMISQQQAGPLGRLVLAFQVTPMQYTRLMKRSVQDLVAGRGDMKTHISKIIYYGAVQNMIFNALQSAVFALAFNDDEEDDEDKMSEKEKRKAVRVANNMADSLLRGLGVQGAAVATIKNMIIKFLEQEKRGYRADHAYTMIEGLNISPPIGSKARKVYSATQTYKFNRDAIKEMGFDIDNPAYEAVGNIVSGTTNVPLDRVIANVNNVRAAMDKNNAAWQRISVLLGWNAWDVGIPDREVEKVKQEIKKRKAEERKRKKSKK